MNRNISYKGMTGESITVRINIFKGHSRVKVDRYCDKRRNDERD